MILLLGLGLFGMLGVSILCPLLAFSRYQWPLRKTVQRADVASPPGAPPIYLEIIIPAHNEDRLITATLRSLQQAVAYLHAHPRPEGEAQVLIHVGADGCSDHTSQEARLVPSVQVTEFEDHAGKWAVLKTLVTQSTSDWVILVDSGTLWPNTFLVDVLDRMSVNAKDVMAIAPAYMPLQAGWLARLLWRFESTLKRIESRSGGPISLHGATIAYHTPFLKKALETLGDTRWLNDDVVIPLTLRALYPDKVILYPVGVVQDGGLRSTPKDLLRRKRLLLGNLQWVRALLPACMKRNPVAGLVASRRVFRVFWAYWIVMLAAGLALAFHVLVLPGMAALGVLLLASGSVRQLTGAALISLLAPYLLLRSESLDTSPWA